MYKDVKKKLLAVVLCICMVIGVVEIVPRVRAADARTIVTEQNGYYPIDATESGTDIKLYVKIEGNTTQLPYINEAYEPKISQVITDLNNPVGTDITQYFSLVIKPDSGSNIDAGNFDCYLALKPGAPNYSIDQNQLIRFTITPSTITSVIVRTGAEGTNYNAALKSSKGVIEAPHIEEVLVKIAERDEPVTLRADQYTASPITSVAKDQTSTITVNASSNFSNPDNKTGSATYDVGYDLGTEAAIPGQVSHVAGGLRNAVIPQITIGGKKLTNGTGLTFAFKDEAGNELTSEQISSPGLGKYQVTITSNENRVVTVDGNILCIGSCTLNFELVGNDIGADNIIVKAYELTADGRNLVTLYPNSGGSTYRVPLDLAGGGQNEVLPIGMTVYRKGSDGREIALKADEYTTDFGEYADGTKIRPTKAGMYNMTINVRTSSNETAKTDPPISYYVYAGFVINEIRFRNDLADETEVDANGSLPYSGAGYRYETLKIEDVSGNSLREGTHYNVAYQYESSPGNWTTAADFDDPNMVDVGKKRLHIVGVGNYSSVETDYPFTIAPIDMETNKHKFTTFDVGGPYYYTGEKIKPTVKLAYNYIPVPEDQYEVVCNDINAGSAEVTVKAKDGGRYIGSLTKEFTISPVQLSDTILVDKNKNEVTQYPYTGSAVTPLFMIKQGGKSGNKGDNYGGFLLRSGFDYTVEKYEDITDAQNPVDMGEEKPVRVGEYRVTIRSATNNIAPKGDAVTFDYEIVQHDIKDDGDISFTVPNNVVEWNGVNETGSKGTTVDVVCGSTTMVEGTDYDIVYVNNNLPTRMSGGATPQAIVTAKGNYTGTKELEYIIAPRKIYKPNITVTPEVDRASKAPNYTISLTVRDNGTGVSKPELEAGTDYEVEEVRRFNDETQSWDVLPDDGSVYEVNGKNVTTHKGAGKYWITVRGKNNYEGTTLNVTEDTEKEQPLDHEIAYCGTDISAYTPWIVNDTELKLEYNTFKQMPSDYQLRDARNQKVEGITYNKKAEESDFTVMGMRDPDDGKIPMVDVGLVYVLAVGNPMKGYYGRTTLENAKAGQRGSYEIIIPEQQTWGKEFHAAAQDVVYMPMLDKGTLKPVVTVTYGGIVLPSGAVSGGVLLHEGVDYELSFDKTVKPNDVTEASKTLIIKGINNFAGLEGTASYKVLPADISDPKLVDDMIDKKPIDYIERPKENANPVPQIKLQYHNLEYALQEGMDKDYITEFVSGPTAVTLSDGSDGYEMIYTVTGRHNFIGTRDIHVQLKKTSLKYMNDTLVTSREEAEERAEELGEGYTRGYFYINWIERPGVTSAPGPDSVNFTIQYYQTSTREWIDLERSDAANENDFTVTAVQKVSSSSEANKYTMTIQGKGGYYDSCNVPFTLYTDITYATLSDDSFIQEFSGSNDSAVTRPSWIDRVNPDGTATPEQQEENAKALLMLKIALGSDEYDLEPDGYKVTWQNKLSLSDPKPGSYKVTVKGLEQAPYYYTGTAEFTFKIIDGIDKATVRVNKNSNSVAYPGLGQTVELTAKELEVIVDGTPLVLGVDYEIDLSRNGGYEGNDRIGEAKVFLKGIGNYGGTIAHTFYIKYPLSDLVAFVEDQSGHWINSRTGNAQYTYKGEAICPRVELYFPLDDDADKTGDYEKYSSHSVLVLSDDVNDPDNDIEYVIYSRNSNVGTGRIGIGGCPYLTGTRDIDFNIVAGDLDGTGMKYESVKGFDLNNLKITYGGRLIKADDFGVTVSDRGTTLEAGKDYNVYVMTEGGGDAMNVTKEGHPKPILRFAGINGYAGSIHDIPFTIEAQTLDPNKGTPSKITANPVSMTYTDNPTEYAIIDRMDIVFQTIDDNVTVKLKGKEDPKDFEIEGYYKDPSCTQRLTTENGGVDIGIDHCIPKNQGDYYIKVKGCGNFKDFCVEQLTIIQKTLNNIKITFVPSENGCPIDNEGEPECTYNGSAHEPKVVVEDATNGTRLSESDYDVRYENNINASISGRAEAIVTMKGDGNYTGEARRTFTIKQKDIRESDTIIYDDKPQPDYPFDGTTHQPEVTIYNNELPDKGNPNDQKLIKTNDYDVEYKSESEKEETADNAPACSYGGKVVMTITGKGNYTGTQQFVYYIGEDIGAAHVEVNGARSDSKPYNGLKHVIPTADIRVIPDSSDVVLEGPNGEKRYSYAYYKDDLNTMVDESDVVDVGTYYIAVTGNPKEGTYAKSTESNSFTYVVTPRSIAQSYILVSGYDASYYYTGKEIRPAGIVVEDTQLPANPDNPNGSQYRSVKLVNGVDYDISYSNNTYAGKASIVVTGKGNYSGTRDAYFTIISSDTTGNNTGDSTSEGSGSLSNGTTTIYAKDIVLGFSNSQYNCMLYNGSPQTPIVSINGLNNNDFMVTARNNIAPGVATLEITGIGTNYTGTIYKNYLIKADLSQYGTILGIPDQVYTGYQITPTVTLTCGGNLLNQGSDFTVTYANNTNVGRATVMAHATGNSYYIGTATGGFNISNAASGMQVTGYASAYTYTGYAITPDVVVTMNGRVLNRGTDYTVSYANNINVGTASMTVTGLGSYSGSRTINFTIEAKNIENCLTTEVKDYQYNGSTYTPVITVTDSSTGKTLIAGTDYTITYSNNTNPGTAQITVTALSKNYTGTKVIPFQITSAAVSGLRTSTIKNNSIKLAWSKQEYADGYQICNSNNRVVATTRKNSYTVKGLTSCTTYKFKVRSYVENADGTTSYGNFSTAVSAKTLLNTPKLSAKASGSGKITLTWTKVAKATGYEIYYSTKKNGKYTRLKTVSKSSKRKYVDKGLAKGEKYYYTIRAYRTANGVKTYSNFNTIKSVKVK